VCDPFCLWPDRCLRDRICWLLEKEDIAAERDARLRQLRDTGRTGTKPGGTPI